MQFRLLGPIEVVDEEHSLPLGGPKQRAVLAHLVLRAKTSVSRERLIDGLWGDDPPETARNTLQTYLYRLRRVLGDDRITTEGGGYLLRAEPDEIDAARFEAMVNDARGSVPSDPAHAREVLSSALALWRGSALADLADEPSLRGEIARLEELRLSATEHLIATQISLGSHSAVVPELESLTAHYPLRERLWASLMLALYRSGRQAEALSTYEKARQVLADELGTDPSSELQRLYQQILQRDPALDLPSPISEPRHSRADMPPGTEFAGYRIERVLGRGGMSVVYLAEHLRLRRKVALKVLAPQLAEDQHFRERFDRESQVAASIDHPNVIAIYEAGGSEGQLFIAMRYVEGRDLRALLHEEGFLEAERTVRIAGQVADALDAAHARGLVHRDVKPGNVLLAEAEGRTEEHALLSDFGLTKRAASESGVTGTGQFVGTLDYAAPEQFEGKPLTPRTDVYSLGCLLYECLAGSPPFRRETDAAVMYAHLMQAPPRLTEQRPDLPRAVDDVLDRTMSKQPNERYPSAGAAVDELASALGITGETLPRARRQMRRRRSRRGRRIAIGAIAAGVTVALVATLVVVLGEEPAEATFAPGIAIVDQETGEALATIPTSAIREPAEVVASGGSFWVHNLDPNSFVQVDAAGKLVTQIASPFEEIGGFAVDGDTLWVTGGKEVAKIDTDLRREVVRFGPFSSRVHAVVVAEDELWITLPDADQTLRLDAATGEVERRFNQPGSLNLAYGDGSVWTAGWIQHFGGFTGSGAVNRIDTGSDTVTTTDLVLSAGCCPIAAGGGFGWTTDAQKGVVYEIDRSGQLIATLPAGSGAEVGSFDDGRVWVRNADAGTVAGIDAVTGERRSFEFGHPLQGLAAAEGLLLVSVAPGPTFDKLFVALEGDVARLLTGPSGLEVPDPAIVFSDSGFWVEEATCAKLLNYVDAPAPEGWVLRPEVAAAMPEVSTDGRTYTFTIRPGYRFSPPSNEPVTAETFRYSIERAVSPTVASPNADWLDDVEGFNEFVGGETEHVSGLHTEGDRLMITLGAPSPDFLHRLAVPNFCPVPTDAPFVPGGAGPAVPYPHRIPQPVASAGPYYIADHLDGEYVILKRNPNYPGPRPQGFDAFVLREGIDAGVAVDLVERGAWDGMAVLYDRLLTPTGPVAEEYGMQGEAGESSLRYDATPTTVTGFFAFNASRQPFSDPDVRRAASLVLDRETLAELWGNVPGDQYLSPAILGYEDHDLYPLDGSALEEARSLLRGRTPTVVLGVLEGNPLFRSEAEVVRADLARMGMTVKIEVFTDFGELVDSSDIVGAGIGIPVPDPVSYLWITFNFLVPDGWLPPGIGQRVDNVFDISDPERRVAAAADLADSLATEDVPIAVDLFGATPSLLSPRLGCRVFPPLGFGIDLAALCPAEGP